MRKAYLFGAGGVALGLLIGLLVADVPGDSTGGTSSDEKEILYWVAPMDANYRRNEPGKSPMGMDLVPVYAGEETGGDDENELQISASTVNNIGVRTAAAIVSDLNREIDTVGFVTIDETRTAHVHVRTSGWIDVLYRKAVGEPVKKGEPIFELYSPDLVSAQAEYLQALKLNNQPFLQAAEHRLRALGMTISEINTLKTSGKAKERIAVQAPQDGVIMALNVGEGMYVTPGQTVFSLADLSRIWVKAEIFEAQTGLVSVGQEAELTFPYLPGESWTGAVGYIYPEVDPKSRTVQVRLSFANTDGRLKPNMHGDIIIAADASEGALSIPREALIRTGKTDRVILALGDGRFRPAEVIAGAEIDDRVIILDGLSEGEDVVTSGQFLIDSEASLNGAFLRMLEADDSDDGDDAEDETVHHGMGTVEAFKEDGKVTLTHDPIETLGWPSMTMDFMVAANVDLSPFELGDRMHFTIVRTDEGPFMITMALKM